MDVRRRFDARKFSAKIVEEVLQQVLKGQPSLQHDGKIPIGVSARHVHLAQAEVELLFGENYQLTPKFELSQPASLLQRRRS